MPRDPFVREKFTKERTAARKLAAEYFQRFPKDRYQTAVDSWRELQSQNIEFTMKRLREPIERATEIAKGATISRESWPRYWPGTMSCDTPRRATKESKRPRLRQLGSNGNLAWRK